MNTLIVSIADEYSFCCGDDVAYNDVFCLFMLLSKKFTLISFFHPEIGISDDMFVLRSAYGNPEVLTWTRV